MLQKYFVPSEALCRGDRTTWERLIHPERPCNGHLYRALRVSGDILDTGSYVWQREAQQILACLAESAPADEIWEFPKIRGINFGYS